VQKAIMLELMGSAAKEREGFRESMLELVK
jgi:hypothetical protein